MYFYMPLYIVRKYHADIFVIYGGEKTVAVGIFKEYTLGTNNFKKPVVYEGRKAIGIVLVRLLLMTPGSNPLHPKMGVGIPVRYRYLMADRLQDLRSEIATQIARYLAHILIYT